MLRQDEGPHVSLDLDFHLVEALDLVHRISRNQLTRNPPRSADPSHPFDRWSLFMSQQSTSSCSFLILLALLFITLKLLGVINWTWWGVLAPLWVPVALVIVFLMIIAVVALLASFLDKK